MSDKLSDLQIDKGRTPLGGITHSRIEDGRKHGKPRMSVPGGSNQDVSGGKSVLDESTPLDMRGVNKTSSPGTPGKAPGTNVRV